MEDASVDSRMLHTLERLLAIPGTDLSTTLAHVCDLVADALRADKVDAFLYDPTRDTLVALGTSGQPLSAVQRKHGLDALAVANGGRTVQVFETNKPFLSGHLDEDEEELRGIREVLQVRSTIGVPLQVGGSVRGVLMVASQRRDFFTEEDARFAESVARWVDIVAHRAELIEEIARNAVEQGRRAVAEELVTVLAHDMKNYLSPLSLRLDVLHRRAEREERVTEARELALAQQSLARINALIADLLDVARIDTGLFEIDVRPIDIVALSEDIAATVSSPELPVHVRAREDVVVTADPARLRQCLHNLIANAIKHSPKNGSVTVLIGVEPHEERSFARVDVIDDGPGVAPELAERLFERFAKGKQGAGLGLGLYLAKRIAVMHGGDLTLTSSPKGARFTLTLPCA